MSVSKAWNVESRTDQGSSRADRIKQLESLANFLDTAIALPGTNIRVGFDAVIGLIPGVGDVITTVTSLYIVHQARQLGAPTHLVLRMLGNIAIDGLAGSIPFVGDVFDTFYRSNRRNMDLLRRHLDRQKGYG
jgi:Domain of unknown function (DUF4112)